MKTLYKTLEQLALELHDDSDIGQTVRVVALVYDEDIADLPWRNRQMAHAKLRAPRAPQHLIALVLREMRRQALAVLLDQGCGIFTEGSARPTAPLPAEHAAIVRRYWDSLSQAPAWTAFESQIDKLASRYAEED